VSSRANTLTSLKAAAPRTLSIYSTSQGLAQGCGETCSSLWKWHKSCEHIVPQSDELVLSIRHRCECSCYSSHTAIGPEDLTKRWSCPRAAVMICVLVACVFILLPCALSLAEAHLVLVRRMWQSHLQQISSQTTQIGRAHV